MCAALDRHFALQSAESVSTVSKYHGTRVTGIRATWPVASPTENLRVLVAIDVHDIEAFEDACRSDAMSKGMVKV